jgi:ubiquinol-cytochrome c reductase cytochrome b subunit
MSKVMALITCGYEWFADRFPITRMWREHMSEYYAPKNFNIWYYFGALALVVLAIQIITGIFLTMNYKPDADLAFASVEYIMRDVQWGWVMRYMHSTGASAFFVLIYLHMFRALLYGSYKKPRELVWIFGMAIYLCLMAEAFLGYLLPWGQMSYWGAQVIISLFSAVPVIGEDLSLWIRGDYVVSDITLNRFFALHVIAIPFALVGLVVAHILALHEVGSNNPDGVEIKEHKDANGIPLDGIPFHPYYTVKDIFSTVVFLMIFAVIVFFIPELNGYFIEHANFIPADPLKTPEHIAPLWYFTPFYAILRAVPSYSWLGDQFGGVMAMGAAVMILFALPWIDRNPVKSIRYRSTAFKLLVAMFVICFFGLGYLGMEQPSTVKTILARIFAIGYFAFFAGLYWLSKNEKTKPVPERVNYK